MKSLSFGLFLLLSLPIQAMAGDGSSLHHLAREPGAILAAFVFVMAMLLVMLEGKIHVNKAIPVIIAAGVIWLTVVVMGKSQGEAGKTAALGALDHAALEYTKVMLFLMVAMAYVNSLTRVGVFDRIRDLILEQGFTKKTTFWITGLCAFWLSPVLDNLTTALVMYSVAAAIAGKDRQYLWLSSINIVVAANAGGAFSPAGDVTSTMVFMAKKLAFGEFIPLIIPAIVCWIIPATAMSLSIQNDRETAISNVRGAPLSREAWTYIGLFSFTITVSILSFKLLEIPPLVGMMFGLGLNLLYTTMKSHDGSHSVFQGLHDVEWDALVFFYGVVMMVAGISTVGHLAAVSQFAYSGGYTIGNTSMGLVSAVVDNIPVMFAVLQMGLDMSVAQWQLVTLTTGTGGSIIAFGSAAGVALMSKAKIKTDDGNTISVYTSNGKWTFMIAVGYFAGVFTHMQLSGLSW